MPSNADAGAKWKARSKRWLQRHNCEVIDLEVVRIIRKGAQTIPVKRDQLGADLGYFTVDGPTTSGDLVLLQVKGGGRPRGTLIAEAAAAFDLHRFPAHTRRELHIWRPFARDPEVIDMSNWRSVVVCG